MFWLLLIAALIIVALAVYAALLVGRLFGQNKVIKQAVVKRNQRLLSDISYIAIAMQQQRCGLSEGVIRLCNLLVALQTPKLIDWSQRFPAVFQLYDAINELPTHEARNRLPLPQRKRQDQHREAHEQALEQQILQEAKVIAQLNIDTL
ncbi:MULTISPECIES: DUF2489 domain-containing protein [unclassified Agarivorans]|uniref:DUF2489 domain-containing protein n=1 Tax=unclassified Agarivorans TaxID=2636026 RepID=UPI003D7D809B